MNQVGLTRGWTLASFWLERSRGSCDHLSCSGCHYFLQIFLQRQTESKPGPCQNCKAKNLCFPHFFFNLPIPSPHGVPPVAPIVHTHDLVALKGSLWRQHTVVQTSLLLTSKFTESELPLSCLALSKWSVGNQSQSVAHMEELIKNDQS